MPVVGKIFGGLDFSNYFIPLAGPDRHHAGRGQEGGRRVRLRQLHHGGAELHDPGLHHLHDGQADQPPEARPSRRRRPHRLSRRHAGRRGAAARDPRRGRRAQPDPRAPRGTAPGRHRRLDHMVIDVIGSLFDQILSDPKVPPQMARQIARLQLPVLRAALGDNTFFSSRRTRCGASSTASPRWATAVRRLHSDERAQPFLAKVRRWCRRSSRATSTRSLVYEQKLASSRPSSPSRPGRGRGRAATRCCSRAKEALRICSAMRSSSKARSGLTAPDLPARLPGRGLEPGLLKAAAAEGADGDRRARLRAAGREL
jgi:hypothetical protein